MSYALCSYQLKKKLFGIKPKPNIHLGDHFWFASEKVIDEENDEFPKPFSEKEIKEAIMGFYSSGALGSDGSSFLFNQTFRELI